MLITQRINVDFRIRRETLQNRVRPRTMRNVMLQQQHLSLSLQITNNSNCFRIMTRWIFAANLPLIHMDNDP